MGFTWPGDKVPGRHTISYQQHQDNLQAQAPAPGRAPVFGPSWYRAPAAGGAAAPAAAPDSPATDPGAGGDGGVAPPIDPTYQLQVGKNLADEQTALTGIRGSRTRGLQGYGYSGQFDQNDALIGGSLKFDPTDPYSRAALMKKLYDGQHTGTGLQRASAGGLYAGSYQTAQDVVTSQNLQAEDQLQKSLMDYLEGVGTKIGTAKSNRAQADIDAGTAAYIRSLNAT